MRWRCSRTTRADEVPRRDQAGAPEPAAVPRRRKTTPSASGFGVPYIKGIPMRGLDPTQRAQHAIQLLMKYPGASAFLFDGHAEGQQGGTGEVFDWSTVPTGLGKPFVLAGGLRPDNVFDAVDFDASMGRGRGSAASKAPPGSRTAIRCVVSSKKSVVPTATQTEPVHRRLRADRFQQHPRSDRPFRPLRRAVRGRNPDRPAGGARRRLRRRARATRHSSPNSNTTSPHYVGRPSPIYEADAPVGKKSAARASCSSART